MGMATRHCRPRASSSSHGPTRPGTARPPRREPPRSTGLPQPHRPGRQPAVHRAHPGRHRARRAQGQPRHLRHAGKQAGLGTRQHRHHPRGRGTPRAGGRAAPHHPRPASPAPPPKPTPAPPPRSCCWSSDGASSPPATDATRAGTTGTAALPRTATGPKRASSTSAARSITLTPMPGWLRVSSSSNGLVAVGLTPKSGIGPWSRWATASATWATELDNLGFCCETPEVDRQVREVLDQRGQMLQRIAGSFAPVSRFSRASIGCSCGLCLAMTTPDQMGSPIGKWNGVVHCSLRAARTMKYFHAP